MRLLIALPPSARWPSASPSRSGATPRPTRSCARRGCALRSGKRRARLRALQGFPLRIALRRSGAPSSRARAPRWAQATPALRSCAARAVLWTRRRLQRAAQARAVMHSLPPLPRSPHRAALPPRRRRLTLRLPLPLLWRMLPRRRMCAARLRARARSTAQAARAPRSCSAAAPLPPLPRLRVQRARAKLGMLLLPLQLPFLRSAAPPPSRLRATPPRRLS